MRSLKLLIITIFLRSNYPEIFLNKLEAFGSLIKNQGSLLLQKFRNQSTFSKSLLVTGSVLNILASSYLVYHYKTCQNKDVETSEEEKKSCILHRYVIGRYLPFSIHSLKNVLCWLRNNICKEEKHILCGKKTINIDKERSCYKNNSELYLCYIKNHLDIYLFLHVMTIILMPLSPGEEVI